MSSIDASLDAGELCSVCRTSEQQSTDWKLEAGSEATWHSNLSTTADVYTHISPEAERSEAQAIEHKLGTGTVVKHLTR